MSNTGAAVRAVHGTLVKVDPDMRVFIKFLISEKATKHADIKIIEELDHETWLMSTAGIPVLKREIQAHHEHMHKEVRDQMAGEFE